MSYRHGLLPLSLLSPLLLLFFPGVRTTCLLSHSAALLELKHGFSSASALASWLPGIDCCQWRGVGCDAAGRVTALDLSNCSLAGDLTAGLFNLSSLQSLNLSYNVFLGIPIPQYGFERLANLTHLNLSNAGFSGQVPAGIARLHKLVSLDLSTFLLNELPPQSLQLGNPDLRALIGKLANLKELYLDGVNISADGVEWCGAVSDSVPDIQRLGLSGCSLSGPIDASLARLRSLSVLRLSENNLSSTVPQFFGNFSYLSELRLSSCVLHGSFPESVFQLPSLKVLDVSNNQLLSGLLPEFPKGSALESLVLSFTNFSGTLPESIGNLKSLNNLQLNNCSFFGPIPSSIGNLSQLVHLDLSLNGFNGSIPSVDSWENIIDINLSQNRLTGPIPLSTSVVLRNLTKLDLGNNLLSGQIPVSLFSLPKLQGLQLSENKLEGELGNFPSGSSSLGTVDLSSNKLQGEIPSSVFKLRGLKILILAWNNFSGTVELDLLGNLSNLTNLDLSNNQLSVLHKDANLSLSFPLISTLKLVACNLTKIPSFLRHQDKMSILDLSNNKIDGVIPKWIWSISSMNLNYLNLSYNLFTGMEGPFPDLSQSSIVILDLHSNKLKGSIPLPPPNNIVLDYSNNYFSSSFPSNISLYLNFTLFFSLSNNSLTGEIPSSICNAIYIQVLDLSYNNMSGLIPQCLLQGNYDLSVLNLRGNQFHGPLPQNFSKGCKLRTINLNGNKLGGQVPKSLVNCDLLEVLDLGNNQIYDIFPFWLGNIPSLRVLVLRSNQFHGHVDPPPGIYENNHTFSMLQIFDLSSNKFDGPLPSQCFGHLTAVTSDSERTRQTVGFMYLQYTGSSYYQDTVTITSKGLDMTLLKILTTITCIDFSNNELEGGIPEVIGDLKSLYMLNLSHNALAGRIPPVLGSLRQLESLDLSTNHLSGQIPLELTSLTFLSYLNLSNNNLVGRIPRGSQFSTFSNDSYVGNAGLCGSPFSKQCASQNPEPASEFKYAAGNEANWLFVFVGLGFGGGLAMVIGPLAMWKKGRILHNEWVDQLFWSTVAFFGVCNSCRDVKVGACDETVGIEEEGVPLRRFCVFCTRIDFLQGKAFINHVECSCSLAE